MPTNDRQQIPTCPLAGNRRNWSEAQNQPNTWVGKRVLRRIDSDGTRWQISQFNSAGWLTLTCYYRDIRLVSRHPTQTEACRHRDELTRSWQAASLKAYRHA